MNCPFNIITIQTFRSAIATVDPTEVENQFTKAVGELLYYNREYTASDLAEYCLNLVHWSDTAECSAAVQAMQAILYYVSPDNPTSSTSAAWGRLVACMKQDGWTLHPNGALEQDLIDEGQLLSRIESINDIESIRKGISLLNQHFREPYIAIGLAKELVEVAAKVILNEMLKTKLRDEIIGFEKTLAGNNRTEFPKLVRATQFALSLHPEGKKFNGTDGKKLDLDPNVKKILQGVYQIVNALNDIRNNGFGSGHGQVLKPILSERHGRLAVNAAMLWCELMVSTYEDPNAPWRIKLQ